MSPFYGISLGILSILIITGTLILINHLLNEDQFDYKPKLPPQPNCGIANIRSSLETSLTPFPKVINGDRAVPFSYPWIVSLRALNNLGMHFCGGSLIYSDTVLTAAHCVYGLKSSDLAVAVGIYHLNWNLNESNIFYVSKIIIHEKYSKYSVNNDIAILKLIQSVNISSTVSTICLPIHKKELKNSYYKNLITSGWGSTDGENSPLSLSEDLKQTLLTIHDDKYCLKNFPFFEIKTMYCGSFKNSSLYSNICYGDSGGPLFYSENNKWILYGITSLLMTINETLICDPSKPSFFSSVSGFLDWIANNLV